MQNLIEILNREQVILQALLDVSIEKQTALVSNNREKLDGCTKKEEGLLPRIKMIEHERLSEFQSIRKQYDITIASNKLDDFLLELKDKLSDEALIEIDTLQKGVKKIVSQLSKLNQQNLYLINHSRKFIKDTISAIITQTDKSILDRKV